MHPPFGPIRFRIPPAGRKVLAAGALALAMAALGGMVRGGLAAEPAAPFLGGWDLTLPEGTPGWLGVTEQGGQLRASILWGGGSVLPVEKVELQDGQLLLTRMVAHQRKNAEGKTVRATITRVIAARATGDTLELTINEKEKGKKAVVMGHFHGRRTPPLPPAPDLSKAEFGPPVVLFNGKDLAGWRLTDPKAHNGWSVEDGVLVNRVVHAPGKSHKFFGNLRTEREFTDFNLTLETRVPKGGNSGVYLRGIYEVQVFDSYGHPLDSHNMGAVYSRICPTAAAEKPAGQWQTLDITLVARHLTVMLNGQKIIDNQPLLGCTGGALWSDQLRPGPIYLQGDHTGIEYRNIVLRPVLEQQPFYAYCVGIGTTKEAAGLQAQLKLPPILADLGYSGMAFVGLDGATEMLDALERHGQKLLAVYTPLAVDAGVPGYDPSLKQLLPKLKGHGTILWLVVSSKRSKPSSTGADDRAVELLREIADLAQQSGVTVSLYPHVGSYAQRMEDVVRLAKKTARPNVGVTFGLCHFLATDDAKNMDRALETARPYLNMVNLCGTSGYDPKNRADWIQVLGQGSFDVLPIVKTLRRLDYRGPVGIIAYGIKGEPREILSRSIEAWRELSAKAGPEPR